ncbi:MAG: hypothetical protein JWM90_2160 [Thermoleophilia bacterium]|nr:hypothetical protein [Thermoleophilia bacterium]
MKLSHEELREKLSKEIEVVAGVLSELTDTCDKQVGHDWIEEERAVAERWRTPLARVAAVEYMAVKVCSIAMELVNSTKRITVTKRAVFLLHARICRGAREVRLLLSHGYNLGAWSAMRTMYELHVLAWFIDKHGDDTAQRYLEHGVIDLRDWIGQMGKLAGEDVADVIRGDTERLKQLDDRLRELGDTYGPKYLKKYGWANSALRPDNSKYEASFKDIDDDVGPSPLRPLYEMACAAVHGSSYASHMGSDLVPSANMLLVGSSPLDLGAPAIGCIRVLQQQVAVLVDAWDENDDVRHLIIATHIALTDFVNDTAEILIEADDRLRDFDARNREHGQFTFTEEESPWGDKPEL